MAKHRLSAREVRNEILMDVDSDDEMEDELSDSDDSFVANSVQSSDSDVEDDVVVGTSSVSVPI